MDAECRYYMVALFNGLSDVELLFEVKPPPPSLKT